MTFTPIPKEPHDELDPRVSDPVERAKLHEEFAAKLVVKFGHDLTQEQYSKELQLPENKIYCEAVMAEYFHYHYEDVLAEVEAEIEADERHADGLQNSIPKAFIIARA
jgi:hypothetical protein